MFVEIRRVGKKRKYYLVHTYRVGDAVKRVSRYLGSDLHPRDLERLRARAQEHIRAQQLDSFIVPKEQLARYRQAPAFHVDWRRFTEEFTYHTNAIEGSTVAQDDAERLIEKEQTPHTPDERETINVANAVVYLRTGKHAFSLALMRTLHELCFTNTKPFAGRLRTVDVVIRDSQGTVVHRGAPAREVENRLRELVRWYKKNRTRYPPLVLAAMVHNQFEHIHPFQDGNGRVGRLLLNHVLLAHDHPPVNIRLEDRPRYYKALQAYGRTGTLTPMLRLLLRCLQREHRRHPARRT